MFPDMHRTHIHRDIEGVLSAVCTDVGQAARLPAIDINTWTGADVVASCTGEHVAIQNRWFGLCTETANKNSIREETMFLYTNPCLLNREKLFEYFVTVVGQRRAQNGSVTNPQHIEGDICEQQYSFIDEHKKKYILHQQRKNEQANRQHALRLQQNKERLTQLLMPHTISKQFLLQIHHNVSCLLALLVAENSLHAIRSKIITIAQIFNHETDELFRLSHLNEMYMHIETYASTMQAEVLNTFFPPHYACLEKENHLSHTMQPLLDCYARNDTSRQKDENWQDLIKRAYTMQDYIGLMRVEDILSGMVDIGDNIVPIQTATDQHIENDVATLRFIVCVLFVIHTWNTSKHLCKSPMSFTRLDNPKNIIFHPASSTYVYDIAPGRVFCHGGYLYCRPPQAHKKGIILRSKCILSLCLRLCMD